MNKCYWIFPLLLTLLYCESDDICPETTPTTPRIIITFYDINNPDEKKTVESLAVYAIKNNQMNIINDIYGINTDSIAIPLRDDEAFSNFKFYKDFDDLDGNPSGIEDNIYIDYEISSIFISRACGFINNYNILNFLQQDTGWILDNLILSDSITNENQAHVKILH